MYSLMRPWKDPFDLSALFGVNATTDKIAKGILSPTMLLYRLLASALLLQH